MKSDHRLDLDIRQEDAEWAKESIKFYKIVESALDVICEPPTKMYELSLVLANDDFTQALNRDHRGKDKPTNVLSFPQGEHDPLSNYVLLGDIVLSYETIQKEAAEQGKTFFHHAAHMTIHGLLHLFGYDHIHDEEAEEMEALEIDILQTLDIKNPYAAYHLS